MEQKQKEKSFLCASVSLWLKRVSNRGGMLIREIIPVRKSLRMRGLEYHRV